MSYNKALPYYEVLRYNFGPGKNSQYSKDFVGYRAFNYAVFDVKDYEVIVKVFGAYPKEDNNTELGSEIIVLDTFKIE